MKQINLENSYAYFNPEHQNTWRANIRSIIENEDTLVKYYLTKECRAELISEYPFHHPSISEFCPVIGSDKSCVYLRNYPTYSSGKNFNHDYQKKINNNFKLKLNYFDYKDITYREVLKLLRSDTQNDFYFKLTFKYQKNNFNLFTKIDYINFSHFSDYIQPIIGYVPFIEDDHIYMAYIAFNQKKERSVKFDARLKKRNFPSESVNKHKNILKKVVLNFLDFFDFFKVSEFTSYRHLEKAQIKYFLKL